MTEFVERGLTVEIDAATQFATVYQGVKPIATLIRRRVYASGPAWQCFDTSGELLFSHNVTDGAAMLRRLSRRLPVNV